MRDSEAAGLPAISVSPPQGKFLNLLARIQGASNILEVGTLGGYSAIWLARALPPGAGASSRSRWTRSTPRSRAPTSRAPGSPTSCRCAWAAPLDTLPELEREGAGPFDFIFIDADKPSNPEYFEWALKLSRRGTRDRRRQRGARAAPSPTPRATTRPCRACGASNR